MLIRDLRKLIADADDDLQVFTCIQHEGIFAFAPACASESGIIELGPSLSSEELEMYTKEKGLLNPSELMPMGPGSGTKVFAVLPHGFSDLSHEEHEHYQN